MQKPLYVITFFFKWNLSLHTFSLKAPIATKVICFSSLLKCLRSLYGKQCGPRSDCSYRSSLFWVHAVCFYNLFVSNVRQLFAEMNSVDNIFKCIFFLGILRVRNEQLWEINKIRNPCNFCILNRIWLFSIHICIMTHITASKSLV